MLPLHVATDKSVISALYDNVNHSVIEENLRAFSLLDATPSTQQLECFSKRIEEKVGIVVEPFTLLRLIDLYAFSKAIILCPTTSQEDVTAMLLDILSLFLLRAPYPCPFNPIVPERMGRFKRGLQQQALAMGFKVTKPIFT